MASSSSAIWQGAIGDTQPHGVGEVLMQRYQIDYRNMAILPEAQELVVSNLRERESLRKAATRPHVA